MLKRANDYLNNHMFADKWIELDDTKKESVLNYAATLLNSHFNFREGAKETDNYFNAVCEQAIHLLNFEKERLFMQQQGVTYYAVDGLTFTVRNSMISPIARGFLKSITRSRVGYAL